MRSRLTRGWAVAPFCPSTGGTFSLAMHAWDEPAETLLSLAASRDLPLLLPQPGEAVEPSRAPAPQAWWRRQGAKPAVTAEVPQPLPNEAVPRLRDLPWPLD